MKDIMPFLKGKTTQDNPLSSSTSGKLPLIMEKKPQTTAQGLSPLLTTELLVPAQALSATRNRSCLHSAPFYTVPISLVSLYSLRPWTDTSLSRCTSIDVTEQGSVTHNLEILFPLALLSACRCMGQRCLYDANHHVCLHLRTFSPVHAGPHFSGC